MADNHAAKYSLISRYLHWLIAGLIVAQYVLAELAEIAAETEQRLQQLALLANHKSVGMTILALAILRLLWRMFNSPPALPAAMPRWQVRTSGAVHWLLYLLLFALPLSGWLMSSAKSYSVSWFNLIALPDLVLANSSLAEQLEDLHELLAKLLFVVALLHILAALKHWLLDKDGVLQRMATWPGITLMLVALGWAVVQLGFNVTSRTDSGVALTEKSSAGYTAENAEESSDDTAGAALDSTLPRWNINYQQSSIEFSGDQAGAPFDGRWQQWEADIAFAEALLDESYFDVRIQVESVSTGDEERDAYIVGEDFFDQPRFATARYTAKEFRRDGEQFIAAGELRMKGVSRPTSLEFSVQESAGEQVLVGTAQIDRLAWNIGVGDWSDTDWVGQFVEVNVRVVAKLAE